jgi:hypothetical protein
LAGTRPEGFMALRGRRAGRASVLYRGRPIALAL